MKVFQFSLKRMQNYKEQLLEKEKNNLARLRRVLQELEAQRGALIQYRTDERKKLHIKQEQGITVQELTAYQFYEENTTLQLKAMAKEIKDAELEVERQLKVVIAASQELSALDKLEERQLEEYQIGVEKENTKTIEEFVSTQVIRQMHENVG